MLGILIGIVFGAAQFVLLLIGTRSITGQRLNIPALVGQFLCPLAGLVLCAFLDRAHLLVCALIIIGILIVGAVVNTVIYASRSRGNRK